MIKVQVTEEDIALGVRKSCSCCPVALALGRATGAASHVSVGGGSAMYLPPGASLLDEWITVQLPVVANWWILTYDLSNAVGPIEFEIPEGANV